VACVAPWSCAIDAIDAIEAIDGVGLLPDELGNRVVDAPLVSPRLAAGPCRLFGGEHRCHRRFDGFSDFELIILPTRSSFRLGARSHLDERVVDPGESLIIDGSWLLPISSWSSSSPMRAGLRLGARQLASSRQRCV